LTQIQLHEKSWKEYRILTNPTEGEIATGDALNVLLTYLQSLSNKGMPTPVVALDGAMLSRINVITPYAAGSAGILKKGGVVTFPIVLQGETQQELAEQLQEAVANCVNGTLELKTYQQVRATLDQLKQEHKTKFHKSEINGSSYLIGKRFLDSLEDSVTMLEQPGAAQLLSGSYMAKGEHVAALIQNMIQQGLKFAPAVPGDEPAYMSLHASMVTYANKSHIQAKNLAQQVPVMP
jgi:hypothetical protein